ncbi:MAG TPA: cupin domain-containing protein [Candidatus Binatia bacterium]
MTIATKNIFERISGAAGAEEFLTLLEENGVKIQRIVSHASSTPEKEWYDQAYPEWVLVVRGHAVLEFEGAERVELNEGDYLTIAPHARHRVDETGPETIWLVVHLKQQTGVET